MKTTQLIIYLLLASNLIGQITENDLKGEWVVITHQATSGPNDTMMMVIRTTSQYHDLALYIGQRIYLLQDNKAKQNHLSSTPQDECNFRIMDIEKIEDVDNYLFSNFMVRPIQLDLDKDEENMMIISTSCEDELFNKIYYFNKNKIGLHKQATFFIFKRK